jgi:hypothetical protein
MLAMLIQLWRRDRERLYEQPGWALSPFRAGPMHDRWAKTVLSALCHVEGHA